MSCDSPPPVPKIDLPSSLISPVSCCWASSPSHSLPVGSRVPAGVTCLSPWPPSAALTLLADPLALALTPIFTVQRATQLFGPSLPNKGNPRCQASWKDHGLSYFYVHIMIYRQYLQQIFAMFDCPESTSLLLVIGCLRPSFPSQSHLSPLLALGSGCAFSHHLIQEGLCDCSNVHTRKVREGGKADGDRAERCGGQEPIPMTLFEPLDETMPEAEPPLSLSVISASGFPVA